MLRFAANSSTANQIDLLTVLIHELGRVLGLQHGDEITEGLMDDLLGVRIRRRPTAERVDAVFNSDQ